ncbi:MAG: hypothetical protein ACPGXK_06175 [Phycisphaerae bacterium]
MRKKGPRIRDLAREMGVTSKTLMLRCREEGIFAQNSITRVEPALVPTIRSWFGGTQGESTETVVESESQAKNEQAPVSDIEDAS